jgi:hypothetical protein
MIFDLAFSDSSLLLEILNRMYLEYSRDTFSPSKKEAVLGIGGEESSFAPE